MDYRENRESRERRGYEDDFDYDERDYRNDYRARRNGRRYRSMDDDYMEELSECIKTGVCASKDYEKLAGMTDNREDKNKLMKMAQREKEHYEAVKEMLEKNM